MGVDPKYSNSSVTIPSPTADRQPRNNQVNQDQSRYSKQWGIRLVQTVGQGFGNGSVIPLGFNTILNTYQALGAPKYNLQFVSGTSGGQTYPYLETIIPQSGFYSTSCNLSLNNSGTSGTFQINLILYINGAQQDTFIGPSQAYPAPQSISGANAYTEVFLNAGDTVWWAGQQVQTAVAYTLTSLISGSTPVTFMSLRYLGPG